MEAAAWRLEGKATNTNEAKATLSVVHEDERGILSTVPGAPQQFHSTLTQTCSPV